MEIIIIFYGHLNWLEETINVTYKASNSLVEVHNRVQHTMDIILLISIYVSIVYIVRYLIVIMDVHIFR